MKTWCRQPQTLTPAPRCRQLLAGQPQHRIAGLLLAPTTLFVRISSHPTVFFSHNKPANSIFSHNKPAKRTGCTLSASPAE
jgi:hypothetical protein